MGVTGAGHRSQNSTSRRLFGLSRALEPEDICDRAAPRGGRRAPEATAHRTGYAGVEAMTLATARNFPRHSHEGYGVGLLVFGGHRSWSGLGYVEALPGDMITVNPGEIHDGQPMRGQKRGWRMIYLRPTILNQMAEEAETGPFEFVRPAFRDEPCARMFVRLFSALTAHLRQARGRGAAGPFARPASCTTDLAPAARNSGSDRQGAAANSTISRRPGSRWPSWPRSPG